MDDEVYDVFDKAGKKTDTASWTKIHENGLIHKTAAVLIFRDASRKEILIIKRSKMVKQSPGLWQHSAGGHILTGENPEDGIKRELQEELFTDHEPGIELTEIASFFNNDMPNNNEIFYVYEAVYSGPFSFNRKEVEDIRWIGWGELMKDMKKNPNKYTQAFHNVISAYTSAKKSEQMKRIGDDKRRQ